MKFTSFRWLALLAAAPLLLLARDAGLPPAAKMKPLGLIGGLSWYSTADYYRSINKAVNDAYGDNTNPPLIVYTLNQQRMHELQTQNRWDDIATMLAEAAARLHAAGAEGILFCANTPHKVYAQVASRTSVPILHIADAAGAAIKAKGLHKVGLIGTLYTMEDSFFADRVKARFGIECVVPDSPAVRRELHRIVHEELGLGIFKPESKKFILAQLEALRQRGSEGVVLGCTEFPLIISQADLAIPVFDTVQLHSQMAVDFILGRSEVAAPPK